MALVLPHHISALPGDTIPFSGDVRIPLPLSGSSSLSYCSIYCPTERRGEDCRATNVSRLSTRQ